jgi:serine/threonine-protein kinase
LNFAADKQTDGDVRGSNSSTATTALPAIATVGTAPTVAGSAVGTPAYMSPEQAAGEHLGPASDAYSLGATLYFLLTRHAPFEGGSAQRLIERVRRGDFPRPREVNRAAPAPLEAIVLRAMAHEPKARYSSARALAEDLERWLADEPVSVYRDTWSERTTRWGRRHRRGVQAAAAALVAVTIVSSVAAVLVRSAKDDLEREHARVKVALTAETEAKNDARQAIDNYVNLVTEERVLRDEHVQPLRRRLLQDALRYYQELVDKHGREAQLRQELANAILRVGQINNETGSKEEAIKAFREALAMFQDLAAEHAGSDRYQRDLALAYRSLGLLEHELSRHDQASVDLQAALDIQRRLADEHPNDERTRSELAVAFFSLGLVEPRQSPAALDHLQQAQVLERPLADAHPDLVEYQVNLANTYFELGRLHEHNKRYAEAIAQLEPALAIREKLAGNSSIEETALDGAKAPDDAQRQSDLAAVYNALAVVFVRLGRSDEARTRLEQALDTRAKLVRAQPMVTSFQRDLAVAHNNLAVSFQLEDRYEEALEHHRVSQDIRQRLADDHPTVPRYQVELSDTFYNVGEMLGDLGRWDEALTAFEHALAVKQKLSTEHTDGRYQSALGAAWGNVGRALARLGRFAEALEAHQKAVGFQQISLKETAEQPRFHELLAIDQAGLVVALLGLEKEIEAAEAEAERAKISRDQPEALYQFAAGMAGLVKWGDRAGAELSSDARQRQERFAQRAIAALGEAIAAGYADRDKLASDPLLAALSNRPDFRALLEPSGGKP